MPFSFLEFLQLWLAFASSVSLLGRVKGHLHQLLAAFMVRQVLHDSYQFLIPSLMGLEHDGFPRTGNPANSVL